MSYSQDHEDWIHHMKGEVTDPYCKLRNISVGCNLALNLKIANLINIHYTITCTFSATTKKTDLSIDVQSWLYYL